MSEFTGVAVKGGCFDKEVNFQLFPKQGHRISLVFGRNGSGKTTISRALAILAGKSDGFNIQGRLVNSLGDAIELKENTNLLVFNEDFIDKNVKIKDDGLGAVVLFGEQLELDEKISKKQTELDGLVADINNKNSDLQKYNNEEEPCSPLYFMERMKNDLKEHWAERYKNIKFNSVRGKVTESVALQIASLNVEEKRDDIALQYKNNLNLLKQSVELPPEFSVQIPQVLFDVDIDNKISSILGRQLTASEPTEREKKILSVIKGGRQNLVEDAKKLFSQDEVDFCPYCFQSVSKEYKEYLLRGINNILNEEVDRFKRELDFEFPEIVIDELRYRKIDSDLTGKILELREFCNIDIHKYKILLDERRGNLYQPLKCSEIDLAHHLVELNEVLFQLEEVRKACVDASSNTEIIKKDLELLNKKLAFFEIEQDYRQYQAQEKVLAKTLSDKTQLESQYTAVQHELDVLKAKKKNVIIAVTEINKSLAYIFCSNNRLAVDLSNGKYVIKSQGKDVLPKDISVGERNALALSYFFVSIKNNKEPSGFYREENLLVLDDPVSSFDFENKIGILSFLNQQLYKVVDGNASSRILVFTHDITVFQDLTKVAFRLCSKDQVTRFRLENKALIGPKTSKPDSEYKILLDQIAKYAVSMNQDLELSIGNSCRRVFEAYTTFLLGNELHKSIKDIKNQLDKRSNYFESLMFKMVMNEESHFEDRASGLRDDMQFGAYVTSDAKRKICRDILCLMYLLTPFHVKLYLSDYIKYIEQWENEIPEI